MTTIICLPAQMPSLMLVMQFLSEKDSKESVLWNYKTHVQDRHLYSCAEN